MVQEGSYNLVYLPKLVKLSCVDRLELKNTGFPHLLEGTLCEKKLLIFSEVALPQVK